MNCQDESESETGLSYDCNSNDENYSDDDLNDVPMLSPLNVHVGLSPT